MLENFKTMQVQYCQVTMICLRCVLYILKAGGENLKQCTLQVLKLRPLSSRHRKRIEKTKINSVRSLRDRFQNNMKEIAISTRSPGILSKRQAEFQQGIEILVKDQVACFIDKICF